MLSIMSIDLDDTIVATTHLSRNCSIVTSHLGGSHTISLSASDTLLLHTIDELISSIITPRLATTRVHIITLASWEWIELVLPLFPKLYRMYKWNLITVTACGEATKLEICKQLLVADEYRTDYTEFVCCGDADHDVTSLPLAKALLGLHGHSRTFKFVAAPTLQEILYQWSIVQREWAPMGQASGHLVQRDRHLTLIRPPQIEVQPQPLAKVPSRIDVPDVDDAMEPVDVSVQTPVPVECG